MTRPGAGPVRDVRVALPTGWWVVPLRDAAARERSVTALVAQQFAGVDDQPILKAAVRDQLLQAATDAAQAAGRLMAISLQRAGDVPVPASLVLHWIELGAPPRQGATPGSHLDARVEAGPVPGRQRELARVDAGRVLREVSRGAGPAALGAERLTALQATYCLEMPHGEGVVELAFSTPLAEHETAMLTLFDAIVASVRWVDDGAARLPDTPHARA